jgi:hypothetical protein
MMLHSIAPVFLPSDGFKPFEDYGLQGQMAPFLPYLASDSVTYISYYAMSLPLKFQATRFGSLTILGSL